METSDQKVPSEGASRDPGLPPQVYFIGLMILIYVLIWTVAAYD